MRFFIFVIILIQSECVFSDAFTNRLTAFSAQKTSQAKFIETWSADYLDEPLITKGKLLYKATGLLEKTIKSPEFMVQKIEGNQLSITRNGEVNYMQLTDEPVLAAGIYALRDVLEGNKNNLQKHFKLDYSEQKNDWILVLKPKNEQIAQKIKSIILRGKFALIKQIRVNYRNDDYLVTDIFHDK